MNSPLKVVLYQRKTRPAGNFGVERTNEAMVQQLEDRLRINVVCAPHYSNGIFDRVRTMLHARRQACDVFHVTGDINFAALLRPSRRTVITILDLGILHTSNPVARCVKWLIWMVLPLIRSAKIVAISDFIRSEILRSVRLPQDRIEVIHVPAIDGFTFRPKKFAEIPTILQLGTAPNKNIERLAEALAGVPCRLVIVGKLSSSQRASLEEHHVAFVSYDAVDPKRIVELYEECDIVAFCSTYEGFGMPIVEANMVGRPVVTSNAASMPEVAGDAACLVDPLDPASIRSGFLRIITDAAYREDLVHRGKRNAGRFAPSVIAEQYQDLYGRVAQASAGEIRKA